ncbi:GNAT family N-acetyltransferase [Glutamicibacter sp. BW78]|uniref:GNAT family N-acetyltransferase n=1 Tax=Glutamicibacter sp. BW78 TaxID=2024403 RepID=UPI0013045D42|nr:GNAT family N-acetyltransferase [Glutamicibacter sp. BW78]
MEIGSFEIRRATPADMLGVADLLAEWPGHEEEAQMIRRGWMSEDLLHWVAADDSCVVGWLKGHHEQPKIWQSVRGFEDKREGWLCSYLALLFVGSSARGSGVATALLDAFECEARDHGNSLVMLNPDASEPGLEDRLRSFYGKRGYSMPIAKDGNSYLLAKSL